MVVMRNKTYSYDTALIMKATGLIAASAAVATILDLGAAYVEGAVILDVSAIEFDTADEKYEVLLQVSNSATFADTSIVVAAIKFGDAANGAHDVSTAGRYVMHFCNEQYNTVFRYARLYTVVSGTVATGINYTGVMAKNPVA
jgi:hypothetical protein